MSEIHVEGYCARCGRFSQAWRAPGFAYAFTCDDCESRERNERECGCSVCLARSQERDRVRIAMKRCCERKADG
jgi:hypothetical protein